MTSLVVRLLSSFCFLQYRESGGRPGIIYHMSDIRVERRVERTYLNMGRELYH